MSAWPPLWVPPPRVRPEREGGTANPLQCQQQHDWIGWKISTCSPFGVENRCRRCCVRMVSNYFICELRGQHQWCSALDSSGYSIRNVCIDCHQIRHSN